MKRKGFTIIELLITLAVIGILTSITLVALGTMRSKAQDAKIKAQLAQLNSNAELFYDASGNYGPETSSCSGPGSFFATSNTALLISAAELASAGTATCISNDDLGVGTASSWALSIPLRTNPAVSWCVASIEGSIEGFAQVVGNTATCL